MATTRWTKTTGTLSALAVALMMMTACGKKAEPAAAGGAGTAANVKIGFIVKQPEEPWFQNEWRFAQKAADEYKFELLTIGATDGEKVLAAIDNLGAKGAKGLVICTPDVRLGPAIVAKCKAAGIKLLTVDDQLIGADGKFLDVPHMGISARKIGNAVGEAQWVEMQKRGWKVEDTGVCAVTFDELDTAKARTDGAAEKLLAHGFPAAQIYQTAQKTTDVPGAIDAANVVLSKNPAVKHWLIYGLNDEAVLGAVRAMEGRGLTADNIIGVGIGGDTGKEDFAKTQPTGFFGSILLSPQRHGHDTAEYVYNWITKGVEPPKLTLTDGIFITRDNYKDVLREQGMTP